MNIHGAQQEKKRRGYCYWEFATVSDSELHEWENSLRCELAEPQRELRAVRREIKRRQAIKQGKQSLAWILEPTDMVALKCVAVEEPTTAAPDCDEKVLTGGQQPPELGQ